MTVPGRVTIGIPTINRSRLALRAIGSALAQSYADIEVIVSDDGSTDDTVQRVRELQDRRVVLFEQPTRLGLVGNFNFCLHHASGEFFLLLGDDDVLMPDAIARLVAPFLESQSRSEAGSVGMTWCPCRIADTNSSQFWITESGPAFESPVSMLVELWAGNRGPRLSGILLRTQDSIAVGGYQEKYGDLCDIGNWGPATLLRDRVACVPEPLVQYTNHLGSTTSQSSVKKWQDWARRVHTDLLAAVRARGDRQGERKLAAARTNFISGITLTILIQTIGRPGWVRNAIAQAFRTPGAVFTPYMLRRLLKDGRKVLTVRRSARQASSNAAAKTGRPGLRS
jgi:glycosyltransferase involved in cell wall biosynthesis